DEPPAAQSTRQVDSDAQRAARLAPQVKDALVIRAGPAADRARGLVRLAEAEHLLGFEERVGLLVAEEPRLDLEVGTLVVRERAAPVRTFVVPAPGPDLLPGHVLVI